MGTGPTGSTGPTGITGPTGPVYTFPSESSNTVLAGPAVAGAPAAAPTFRSLVAADIPSTIGATAGTENINGALAILKTTDQLIFGTTNTTTINVAAPTASRTYTLPDVGLTAMFEMSAFLISPYTSSATVSTGDYGKIVLGNASSSIILTLPTASASNTGCWYKIVNGQHL